MAEPTPQIEKVFVSSRDLLEDSFELALRIHESDFHPTFILGVWRGGTPVGIAVQEVLETLDCPTNHFAIRTASYGARTTSFDGEEALPEVEVLGLQHIVDVVDAEDRLLIIDDIFDSGRSVDAIIRQVRARCRKNTPKDIRVATIYYKPKRNLTDRNPDFYVHETDEWTVFPHELRGCSEEELRARGTMPKRYFDMNPKF
ncbi:hypoxanthine phosphoribosyltransferase [Litorimonas cladophorae]|uniref:Hypoxanthine phosphoribosyltransferase n=1 Tax=Litorimonas cladophorae TaxID=1220491 RepID=A0A918KVG6_9PROT|nr:phosphoribosyltransferase family protein [Litorimonas cladophorae]GGX75062.1 hypoxanthine phosphoribosyltransferase [Litorimonas cladophorae]